MVEGKEFAMKPTILYWTTEQLNEYLDALEKKNKQVPKDEDGDNH